MIEEWRNIPGYPGYKASNIGRVKRLAHRVPDGRIFKEKILKPEKGCQLLSVRVGHLILRAFVGVPEPGQICRHLDDDPWHNRLPNLSWGTHKNNMEDAVRNGRIGKGTAWAKKIGDAHRGKNNRERFGQEYIKRLSNSLKGHPVSEETKQKISRAKKGRPLSAAHREKLSRIRKGRVISPEQRIKLSIANRGQKRSEEARAKMRAAWVRRKARLLLG